MKVREARETLIPALREKPEGLTRSEVQGLFPGLTYNRVSRVLLFFYRRGLVGFDIVTDSRRPRWIA